MPQRKPTHRHEPPAAPALVAPEDLRQLDRWHGVDAQPLPAQRASERADEEGVALDAPQEAIEDLDDAAHIEAAEQGEARVVTVGPQGMDEPEAET